MVSIRRVAPWFVGISTLTMACADALRLEPIGQTGSGGSTSSSHVGAGGGTIACNSNADCPEPTSVCDTVRGQCEECLVLADCAFRPGTVCSEGKCACPAGGTYCGPNQCEDLTSSKQHCGTCNHACYGLCTAGACADPWEPVGTKDAPSGRYGHVAVWTGSKMVVWGGIADGPGTGAVASGGIYDPKTFSWVATSTVGSPTPRSEASVVWTGKEMIVWGGVDGQGNVVNDGGRFDPAKNVWIPMTTNAAPGARKQHTAIWTGTEMIVWGGTNASNELVGGARYNPMTNAWTQVMTLPTPVASRVRHCAVWDANKSRMYLIGGFGDSVSEMLNDRYWPEGAVTSGVAYAPVGENWDVLSSFAQPSPRADHSCIFDGVRTIVFGGTSGGGGELSSGATFDPATGWDALGGNVPEPRTVHSAVWLDAKKLMIVFGGVAAGKVLDSGAVYDGNAKGWTLALPRVLSPRAYHTAVSTGDTMIVWGGLGPSAQRLADGGIYKP